jgi:hypothetical protein
VRDVLLAGFDALFVGAEVVVLFRQAEAALVDVGDLAGCVFEVLHGAVVEEDVRQTAIEVSDESGQVLFRAEGGDAIELGLDGGQATLVDGVGVQAAGVVVADLLLVGAGSGVGGRGFFDDFVQSLGIELEEIRELIELRQIGGNGVQFGVVAAGVLIEVDTRVGGLYPWRRGRSREWACIAERRQRETLFARSK